MSNIDQPPPNLQMQADSWIDYIQNVISLFEQMTKSDKEEYFKLHNKYEREHVLQDNFRLNLKIQMLKTIIMMIEAGSTRQGLLYRWTVEYLILTKSTGGEF